MNKQDTYDRLRHNVYTGMQFQHQFRGNLLSPEYDWYATITRINSEDNELKVNITGGNGATHPETWNMEHTVIGLQAGEYLELGDDDAG